MKIETVVVHAGELLTPNENEPIVAPITLSTIFERAEDGSFKHGRNYTRATNPNRQGLEQCLATLEGGAATAAFASGSAATLAVFQALAPGDHVIATEGFYGTTKLLEDVMRPWGLACSLVNTSDLEAVRKALQPQTKLIWLETPSNPQLRVSDIAEVAKIARGAGARLICDNTVATPLLQRCFDLGADLIMHSTTKYLCGHSDVMGGAIVSRDDDDFFRRLRMIQTAAGAVPAPFDCWLLHRGIRTMGLRVPVQCNNALAIARFLSKHPKVERALYPGLEEHPGHAVGKKQMKLFGGLLSFLVRGGREEAMRMAGGLRLIRRASSLGGIESTIEHRASIEPPNFGTPENLLRFSVGIEHVDDLIADLDQALCKL
jgi:cystathionine gamma-synthase